ncbi:MAG: nucleotidyltransferase domain-containing protein [Actinobacteria bacterium]|nr:nucleotidyltransferase domain-containing protein [Actinomycetota bacterium]
MSRLAQLRTDLLRQMVALLRSDPTVQAVALVGSLGHGSEDDWSDIDFMILMDDDQVSRFAARPSDRAWARAPLIVDSRHNAPAGATQINAVHILEGLPFWVDFCVFPAARTRWPVRHRAMFERRAVETSDQTFGALTSCGSRQQPRLKTQAEERRAHLAFVPLAAKYIARGQPEHVRDMIRFIGAEPDYNEMETDGQLGTLRVIASRLSDPSAEWLHNAVTSYLDLIDEAITGCRN